MKSCFFIYETYVLVFYIRLVSLSYSIMNSNRTYMVVFRSHIWSSTVIYALKIPYVNILVIVIDEFESYIHVRASKSYIGKISSYTYVLKILDNRY